MPLIFRNFCLIAIIAVYSCSAWAETTSKDMFFSENNLSVLSSHLERDQAKLDRKNLAYEAIEKIRDELLNIKGQAQACIQTKSQKISEINALLGQVMLYPSDASAKQATFVTQQHVFLSELSTCQYLVYQTEGLLIKAEQQLVDTKEYKTYNNKRPTIWSLYSHGSNFEASEIHLKSITDVFQDSLILIHEYKQTIIYLIIFGIVVGLLLEYSFERNRYKSIRYWIPVFLPLLITYIFLDWITNDLLIEPKIIEFLKIVIMFLSIKYLSSLYIDYFTRTPNAKSVSIIHFRTSLVVNSSFISASLQFFLLNFLEDSLRVNALYFIFSALFFIYFATVCIYLIYGITDKKIYRYFGSIAIVLYFLFRIIFIMQGFESFSSIQLGVVICIVMYYLKALDYISQLEYRFQHGGNRFFKRFKKLFDPKKQHYFIEITLFRIVLAVWLSIILIEGALNILGVSDYYISVYKSSIFDEFSIGSAKIIPINFINAIGVFSFCLFLGKLLAIKIASLPGFNHDIDRQQTVSILVRYTVFAVSLILAFLIIGLGSLQLSLALGGLGFGLGMSLNTLLADFISGMIILIQKPIRHGDYISVMDKLTISGYVQKITLLSTQVLVNDQSIVFVPNSFIIRNSLVNHSARDKLGACFIEIKIKNVDDFVAVREVLWDIVKSNKLIVQRKPNQPIITLVSSPHDFQENGSYFLVHLYFNISDTTHKQKIYVKLKKQIVWRLSHYIFQSEKDSSIPDPL